MPLQAYLPLLQRTYGESLDPVLVLAQDATVVYANEIARLRCGVGTKVDDSSPFGRAVLPTLRTGEPRRAQWGEDGPAGVRWWYTCTLSPIREGDAVLAWLCVCTDITELKHTEERLRRSEQLMVDTQGVAHLGTWEWDISQPHAHWSAQLYRIYGLAPEAYTPSYEGYLNMVHPDDRQRVIDATNRVFHEHVPYSHDERIFRPDGSMRYLHTWAYPILDEQGNLRRLVGVCQDITDRAEAEERVRRLNADLEKRVAARTRQLETSMRDLEAFNAMVSHDLRAPLGTIELALSVLSHPDAAPQELARGRDRIRGAILHMKSLIDDLLAFARIDNVDLRGSALDVSAMAGEIVAELEQANPQRAVGVTIGPGITCFADRVLMRVALQNVIANAWKYTAHVPLAKIEVVTTHVNDRRVLRVTDNGAGFDMKDVHRLFAPFQRLHSDREFTGTGIGLASVHRILERHGCRVWAQGAPGQGATFFLELPDEASAQMAGRVADGLDVGASRRGTAETL